MVGNFPSAMRSERRTRLRRRLRRTLLTALVLACLLSLSGGWIGLGGWQSRRHLTNAAELARDLGEQVLAGDTAQARRTLTALRQQTAAARARTGDLSWRMAGHTPYAGVNLTVGHDLAVALDDLAGRAFPALLELDLAGLLPKSGRIDPVALRAAAPAATTANLAVEEIRARLAKLPTSPLWPPLRAAVRQLSEAVQQLSDLTSAAHRSSLLLPTLLGADGSRTYLLVFQNLAEPRSTGGIFGAYAVLRASNGQLRIVNQGTGADLQVAQQPVLSLDRDFRALYTDLPGIYPADVNLTPHFPTAAALYREMYRMSTGDTVDGVLATDPVALSYLLRALGPVEIPGQPKLIATTAVRTLLSDTYRRLGSSKAQDRYFAASAQAVFDALLHRTVDPRAVATALSAAVTERRILFWTAHADEQAQLVDTRLAGVLPERETVPTVGVFLNDGSGAKLGYYLDRSATLSAGACRSDGWRELALRLTLRSAAPTAGLSDSVLGLRLAGDPYTTRVIVYVFSPVRGAPLSARLDGQPIPMGGGTERGRRVGVLGIDVPPGGVRVVDMTLLAPAARDGADPPNDGAELWLTPGVRPWSTQVSTAASCVQ